MKKTLFSVIACSAILLGLASCSSPAGKTPAPDHKAQIVDLRNKDAKGNVISRSATSEPEAPVEFSYTLLKELKGFDGDIGYSKLSKTGNVYAEYDSEDFKEFVKNISFEDDPDGIKLIFNKPANYANLTWIVFQYVDKNGNRSTAISSDKWDEIFSKDKIEIVYPLVKKGEKANFWLMFGNNDPEAYSTSLFYEIMPAHGKGCVDPMQKDYRETDYAEITDGHILNIKLTIPPKAQNLKHFVSVSEQKASDKAYGEFQNEDGTYDEVTKLGGFEEDATEAELKAAEDGTVAEIAIDLEKYLTDDKIDLSKSEGKPYIFTEFWFTYTLEDYPGFYFSSPAVKPVPVSSAYLLNAAE